MEPEILAAAAAPEPGEDGTTRMRPDSAFDANRHKLASNPPALSTSTSSFSSFSACHLLAAFLLGALLFPLLSLPLLASLLEKLTPPLTATTLPSSKLLLQPAMRLVAAADGLSRALTPPNLRVLKEVAGAWHAAQIRTAAELRLADFLEEAEQGARRECLGPGSTKGFPPSPSLGRRLSCSLRLRFSSSSRPSLTSSQLAELAVPRCRSADERHLASEAAAFAEGSRLPPRERGGGPPLAGCEGVAGRIERLLRALSAYGSFEAESEQKESKGLLSTRWRNSRASRFLVSSSTFSSSSPSSSSSSSSSSLRSAVLLMTREGHWGAWGRLPLAIATGKPGFIDPGRLGSRGDAAVEALLSGAEREANAREDGGGVCPSSSNSSSSCSSPSPSSINDDGKKYHPPDDYWHYLESDPSGNRAQTFDAAMVELNVASASARAVAEDAPFASLWGALSPEQKRRRQKAKGKGAFALDVIDVGGGAGELAAEVLRRHSRGTVGKAVVVDRPRVVARARRAWACAANAPNSSPSSLEECPASLLALAPLAKGYPTSLRERLSFSEGDMFSSRSLSAAVEKGLGSFAEVEEEGIGTDPRNRGRRRSSRKKSSPPRRIQPRRRRLFLLRDVIHDWGDAETVKIFTALRKTMGSAEEDDEEKIGDDGRASHHYDRNHHLFDRDDRVLIVGRSPSDRPLKGPMSFVESKGANDADLLMLAVFARDGAGERTREQTRVLLERAGLELVAVYTTRSWFTVTEARAMTK